MDSARVLTTAATMIAAFVAAACPQTAAAERLLGVGVKPSSDQRSEGSATRAPPTRGPAPPGLLVEQVFGPAASAGIRRGDIITMVEGKPVRTPDELKRAVQEAHSDRLQISVQRYETVRYGTPWVTHDMVVTLAMAPSGAPNAALQESCAALAELPLTVLGTNCSGALKKDPELTWLMTNVLAQAGCRMSEPGAKKRLVIHAAVMDEGYGGKYSPRCLWAAAETPNGQRIAFFERRDRIFAWQDNVPSLLGSLLSDTQVRRFAETQIVVANQEADVDDLAWLKSDVDLCRSASSQTACDKVKGYTAAFPNGRHAAEAVAVLAQAEPILTRNADESSWKEARLDACRTPAKSSDCNGVKEYLRKHPRGMHAETANSALTASEARLSALAAVESSLRELCSTLQSLDELSRVEERQRRIDAASATIDLSARRQVGATRVYLEDERDRLSRALAKAEVQFDRRRDCGSR